MTDDQFREILRRLGLSWEGYRRVRKGVKKRLSEHLARLGCRRVEDYLRLLHEVPSSRREALLLMGVTISRFFRDLRVWDALESRVIPEILASGLREVSVWSAGCGRGEEVYTLKMLWEHLRENRPHLPDLTIRATDRNPENLAAGAMGIYPKSTLREVPALFRERFFSELGKGRVAIVASSLHENILWMVHDLMEDPPPRGGFHLVFLRNSLLTYYGESRAARALPRVLSSLGDGGFLVSGRKESLPSSVESLRGFLPEEGIYRKAWSRGGRTL